MSRTRIICTLGPSSNSASILRKMMLEGMDVARINFSHGSLQQHKSVIDLVRSLNKRYRRKVKVLGDLEGHRMRVGFLKQPLELKKGQIIRLFPGRGPAVSGGFSFDYPGDIRDIVPGLSIYIDDGYISLSVEKSSAKYLECRVQSGGVLKEHKGLNIPGAKLHFSPITDKDHRNIEFCRDNAVEYIAQSFVRNAGDMNKIRRIVEQWKMPPRIIAKIENDEGVRNLDRIISACDGIMIARGDLGVSLPLCKVPLIQKEIIAKCRWAGKFSITATQMMETMTENRRPTRAEVSDVANAIFDGSDFLMLSGETAVGAFPELTVKTMEQIIRCTENYLSKSPLIACSGRSPKGAGR